MSENTVLPTKDALVAAMNGTSVMEGWDVIVSYDQSFLNNHLQQAWKTSLENGVHRIETTEIAGDYKLSLDVKISRPAIKFLGGGDKFEARLSFGLKGIVSERESKDAEVKTSTLSEGTYGISVVVPVVSVPDKVVDREELKKMQVAANELVILDTKNPTQGRLIKFHFDVPKENWKIFNLNEENTTPVASSPFDATAALNLQAQIVATFSKLDFYLAQVNTIESTDTTSVILRPESFLFACHGHGPKAVLSVYMKVSNGGGATPKNNVQFLDASKKIVPLPEGYQTSIIIRHEIIEKFILDSANKSLKTGTNQSPASSSLAANEDGFKFNVKLDTSFIKDTRTGVSFGGGMSYWIEKVNVAFQDHPVVLRIQKGAATWSMDYTTEGYRWNSDQYSQVNMGNGMVMPIAVHWQGAVKLTFKVEKHSTLVTQQSSLSANEVTFLETDVSITPSAINDRPSDLDSGIYWGTSTNDYKDLAMKFDKVTIKFNAINFLLTQNIFGADKSPVNVCTEDGMMTPYDVLLLGDKIKV